MALSANSLGENVPVPVVLHFPLVAMLTFPANTTRLESAQMVMSFPAFTCGAGVMVSILLSTTAVQTPPGMVVRVSVAFPVVLSEADGW